MKTIKKRFFTHLSALGSFEFYILYCLMLLIFGYNNESACLFLGLLMSHTIGIIIRLKYPKKRPKPTNYTGVFGKIYNPSFPSMHSTRIIMVSVFFTTVVQNLYFSILMIFITVFVFYSRIYNKRHDWFDVLGGIVLGLVTYYILLLI